MGTKMIKGQSLKSLSLLKTLYLSQIMISRIWGGGQKVVINTNTSMVHMGIITHHSPLYEGNDQVVMAIQTFIIPLHSFNTSNGPRTFF